MRASVLCVLAVVVIALSAAFVDARRPKWHQLSTAYTFEQYMSDFHKSYDSDSERVMRETIFKEKLVSIMAHNAKPGVTWKQGVNHLTDRTPTELKRMNGGRPREMYAVSQALLKKPHVKVHVPAATDSPVPRVVDYRLTLPPVLTAVKDQGQCGSCWAHGSTENMETYWAIATGELNVASQQQITACAPNPDQCGGTGGCLGSIAELAFEYVVTNGGLTEEWQYPYTAWNGTTGTCLATPGKPPAFIKLTGYTKLKANDQYSVLDALARNGPLSVNVDASTWNTYESGIFSGCDYANNITIDHVVQLVGYGHDNDLGLDYWIVRNSWTPGYGEDGYIRVLKQDNPGCGWDVDPSQGTGCKGGPPQLWTCGMCGILFDTSYPNVAAN